MASPTATAPQYDPSSILSALINNAAALHAAAGLEYDVDEHLAVAQAGGTTPAPTATSTAAHYDPSSILAALIANAEALRAGAGSSASGPAAAVDHLSSPSSGEVLVAQLDPNTPFLSSHLSLGSPHLPIPLPILASTLALMLGVLLALFGAESLRWGISAGERKGDVSAQQQGRRWFKGGFGGLMGGVVFFASLALLLIMAVPGHEKLAPGALYGIIVPVAALGAGLGGRFKWAGRGFLGVSSGLNFVILLLLSIRPALLPRLILLAVFLLVSLALTLLLPLLGPHLSVTPFLSSRALALLSAFSGAVLFGQGVDLLLNPKSGAGPENLGWLDALALVVGTAEDGMMNKEGQRNGYKGLLAGVWLMGVIGTAWQWWRWSKYGDDPAEQWNAYLSSYLESFPGALPLTHAPSARAGSFAPLRPWWQRMFSSGAAAPPRYQGTRDAHPESPLTEIPEKKAHHHTRRTRGEHHEVDTESVWDGDEKRAMSSSESESSSSDESVAAERKDYPSRKRHHRGKLHKRHSTASRPARYSSPNQMLRGDDDADESGTLVGSSRHSMGKDDAEFAHKLDKFGGSYKPTGKTSYGVDGKSWEQTLALAPPGHRGSGMSGSTAVTGPVTTRGMKVEEVSSSSEEESSGDEIGELEGAARTRGGEPKGMVRSLSKIFGGQNKGPARYSGNRDASPPGLPRPRTSSSPAAAQVPPRSRKTSRETVTVPSQRPVSYAGPSSTSPGATRPVSYAGTGATSPVAVPATPSLLNAIQRINRAQADARESGPAGTGAGEGFWAEVEERAAALRSKSPVPGAGAGGK